MTENTLLNERQQLIDKAIRCEDVERVPLIWQGTAAAPPQMGITMKEFVYEPEKGINSQLDYMDKLGVDGVNMRVWSRIDIGLTAAWLSHLKMPGDELPEDSVWQVDEKELMSIDDYDLILEKGFGAFMGQHLPKVIDMQDYAAGKKMNEEYQPLVFKKMIERQYPAISSGMSTIPFETLCGGRSMSPFFMDLYRIPDKVQQVMDTMTPMYIKMAKDAVEASNIRGVWVGGWRTASALLAPQLWDRFVFPYFLEVVNALADMDIVSVLHMDQDWTRDLERFLEFPAKKCVLNLDGMTDIRKAKKILGDHMSILGDVPSELLATGTPEKVREYVKNLIEDVGPRGLLLCPGCEAPVNAKHENMMAMYDAGREFGKA